MTRTLLVAVLLLCACAHHRGGALDPAAALTEARATTLPFALRASFAVKLHVNDAILSTRGGLVLHAPDRFRLEVLGPIGTPALVIVSDGRALQVWNAADNVYYEAKDAASSLQALTGGAVSLSDVVRLLSAAMPLTEAPVRASTVGEDGPVITLEAGPQALVTATLDDRHALLRDLVVSQGGQTYAHLSYGKAQKVGRTWLPRSANVEIPALGVAAELEFQTWDELGQVPEVFSLPPPAGAEVKDLTEALVKARDARLPP